MEQTNQISNKTLGTSVIYNPMSPPSLVWNEYLVVSLYKVEKKDKRIDVHIQTTQDLGKGQVSLI